MISVLECLTEIAAVRKKFYPYDTCNIFDIPLAKHGSVWECITMEDLGKYHPFSVLSW